MSALSFRLAVTTGGQHGEADDRAARELGRRHGLPFVPRGKNPLEPLFQQYDGVLVAARNGVTLWSAEGSFRWAEGLAHLRLERYEQGQRDDQFLRHAELGEGERVLDCTLGLAQDGLLAARAVGPTGGVVGLERSQPLHVLVAEGLRARGQPERSCAISALNADAEEFLRAQPDRSFDLVYLDPMHARPGKAQPSFELLRRWADHRPLTPALLGEARRVARRRVLVKGSRYSDDLKKLGLEAEPPPHSSTVAFAVVPPA